MFPARTSPRRCRTSGANVADHIASAAQNLRAVQQGDSGPFLEQSLYADELSEESVLELQRLARRIWESALRRMFALANERTRIDERGSPGTQLMRMRFGAYFYSERANPLSSEPDLHRRGLQGRQFMKSLLRILVVIVTAGLAGCGGGGGEMVARIGSGGSGAPVSAGAGAVSGFGSIIVNGQHYDETAAQVFVDERPDLPIGRQRGCHPSRIADPFRAPVEQDFPGHGRGGSDRPRRFGRCRHADRAEPDGPRQRCCSVTDGLRRLHGPDRPGGRLDRRGPRTAQCRG